MVEKAGLERTAGCQSSGDVLTPYRSPMKPAGGEGWGEKRGVAGGNGGGGDGRGNGGQQQSGSSCPGKSRWWGK